LEEGCRNAESGQRIEWTGAGGDYFLGVVIDDRNQVIAEFWGTRKQVLAWVETECSGIPAKYVPMALSATRRRAKRSYSRSRMDQKEWAGAEK
jgi:hypothetical protein